jgi:site-specific DNA recombinase
VPRIVDEQTWEAAQRQLHQNFLYSTRNSTRRKYLLRGLIRCTICDSTFVGRAVRGHRYYSCNRKDPLGNDAGTRCNAKSVSADEVEEAVWEAVGDALKSPRLLVDEYKRRTVAGEQNDGVEAERKLIGIALRRLKTQQDRMTDAYINEAMELPDYKKLMDDARAEIGRLEGRQEEMEGLKKRRTSEAEAISKLEGFCERVSEGLETLTFEERQELLRLIVERILVDGTNVIVEAVIPTHEPTGANVRLRRQGEYAKTGQGGSEH